MWTGPLICWRVGVRNSTHVSYLLIEAGVNAGRLSSYVRRGARSCGAAVHGKVGRTLNTLLFSLILLVTVVSALGLGILASYGAVASILFAFGRQSRERVAPVLVHTHASGD